MLLSSLTLATEGADGVESLSALDVFLAVAVVVALALLASGPMFYRIARVRVVAIFLAGGWLAILAGFLLGPRMLSIVHEAAPLEVRPLVMIGLGWIGCIVGMQARRELLSMVPRVLWRWGTVDTIATVLVTGAFASVVLWNWIGNRHAGAWLLLPVVLLATSSIGWTAETRSLQHRHTKRAQQLAIFIRAGSGLCAIFAIAIYGIGFSLVTRNEAGQLHINLPHFSITMSISLVMAALLGFGGRALLRRAQRSKPDMLVVFIALVSLITGLAAEMSASPLFTAMLAGALMSNVRGVMLRDFERFMLQAEHAVAIMFALLAGVFLDPAIGAWGWILVGGLLVCRLVLMWASVIRQSPMAIVLAIGLILSEASLFHQKLLAVIVFTGLIGEFFPMIATLLGRRYHVEDSESAGDHPDEVPA